jgi:histidinol-phosphate/aromatic aminotransferase/cobyric acid decarboxylase-like protein
MTIGDLVAHVPGAEDEFRNVWLGYTESVCAEKGDRRGRQCRSAWRLHGVRQNGSMLLRKAISELYSTVNPNQVLVHVGAEEVIHNIAFSVLDPGMWRAELHGLCSMRHAHTQGTM